MDNQERLKLDALIGNLRARDGGLPRHVRFCEGIDPQKNSTFNKRLFIGLEALWIDLAEASDEIKKAIEGLGYQAHANQKVPDGFGRDYFSTYYRLDAPASKS